jgi:uncharacterized protein with von Willebrand factor type A (vWA) domain
MERKATMPSPTPTSEERIHAAQMEDKHEEFMASQRGRHNPRQEKKTMDEPQEIRIIKDGLLGIEEQMRRTFENMEFAKQSVDEHKENIKLAEINAEVGAWHVVGDTDNGRKILAPEQKARTEQVIATDPAVRRAKTIRREVDTKLASAIAEYEAVKAKYGAYRALADLYAAQLKAEVR